MSKSNPTIQEKIKKLDELIAWFEDDDFELEQASTKLKAAAVLAGEIEHDLGTITNDVQQVKQSFRKDAE